MTTHGALFEAITCREALKVAWKRVRRNKGAPGPDGRTVRAFARGASREIEALSHELIAGDYRPSRPRRLSVPKKSGGTRALSIPNVRDRIVQTSVAKSLSEQFDDWMADASFAYRPGRSVDQALGRILMYRIRGYRWAVHADIASFFDHVPHEVITKILEDRIDDPRTLALVARSMRALSVSADGVRGLAQGSPLSPLLSNLALTPVDRTIATRRVKLVRYADDLLLLARTRSAAEDAREQLEDSLAAMGLRLNSEKSRIVSFREGFEFLGVRFVGDCIVEKAGAQAEASQVETAALS